jgi:parallel beta-helix repeat protein
MRALALSCGLLTLGACAVGLDEEPNDLGEVEGPQVTLEELAPPPDEEALTPEESPRAAATRPPCGDAKVEEILAPATTDAPAAALDCSLTLDPGDVVTKALILQGPAASGVALDCRGAHLDGGAGRVNERKDMIEVRSRKTTDAAGAPVWQRPEDISIRNCRITGSVRVWGLGKNGEAPDVRESSRREGHTARARAAAPRRVLLDNLEITGVGRTNLYLAPGVTEVTLVNSELKGEATSVGLYLDAESAANVIRNNYLHVTSRQEYVGGIYTRKREEIAVDGSSGNRIFNNRLSSLEGGGIYLYRNCGEGGTVRHAAPGQNHIVNNVFYYNEYQGDNPSVFLGSRDNSFWEGRWYCGDDGGFPWGSSADDRSFARHNAVMQNQIYKRSLSEMIRHGDESNRPNTVAYNATVTEEVHRRAGCYVPTGYKDFLLDGQALDVHRGAANAPVCGARVTCDDGVSSRSAAEGCSVERVLHECRASGTNAGCQRTAACPAGKRIVGAAAACNLEYGTASEADLAPGAITVTRASDVVSDGRCVLGGARASQGRVAVTGVVDRESVSFACSERDANGGDCHIVTALYCR